MSSPPFGRQRALGRAIVGDSSGGICAFNAAWNRPDYFRKVVSHIGSFVDILGGHAYPSPVRGDGGHTHKHGGSILPDTLRWLFRDYPK